MATTRKKTTRKKAAAGSSRRTANLAVTVLGTAAQFTKARKIHHVPMGDGLVALVLEPTLADMRTFADAADKADDGGQGITVGGMMAHKLVVTDDRKAVFSSVDQACQNMTVSHLAELGAFIEGISSVARAEGN